MHPRPTLGSSSSSSSALTVTVRLLQSTSSGTPRRRLSRSRRKAVETPPPRVPCQTFQRMRPRTWSCSWRGVFPRLSPIAPPPSPNYKTLDLLKTLSAIFIFKQDDFFTMTQGFLLLQRRKKRFAVGCHRILTLSLLLFYYYSYFFDIVTICRRRGRGTHELLAALAIALELWPQR